MVFKYLISFVALGSSMENEGWFPVQKEIKASHFVEEKDPTIWVLFVKSVGKEVFQVRFPEEPIYSYLENGDIEILSERDGELFQLTVRDYLPDSPVGEFIYPVDGKWVHEQLISTGSHLYHFKTYSKSADGKNMKRFISSFSIEKMS